MTDTIFAVATGTERAALSVIRVSGPQAGHMLQQIAGSLPPPRRAVVRRLAHPVSRETIDQAMVLWMPGPTSFTGEDVAELHLHGGRAVQAAAADGLLAAGARVAEPGEFSRRAFEHGKLDLAEAEAIADLIDAQSDAQRSQALRQLSGETSERVDRWRRMLLEALASIEAEIDFPDEDVPDAVDNRAMAPLHKLIGEINAALADQRGERIREGYRIALVGAPNAGKSSLLNRLIEREAAIVTATPGTTRDVIEQPIQIGGYEALIADTAGMRDTLDPVEAEGVRRATAWADAAALRLWVVDGSASDGAWLQAFGSIRLNDVLVLTKSDAPSGHDVGQALNAASQRGLAAIRASSLTEAGVAELRSFLLERVMADLVGAEAPVVTRARHRRLLSDAKDHLERAVSEVNGPEFLAEDVRLAARSLEAFTGRVDAEAVLGEVFSSFCIGK